MIVVTGASRGLGRAICDRLSSRGDDVLGLARDTLNLPFAATQCDVSSHDEIKRVARSIRRDKIPVEALINCAGIASMNLALTTPPDATKSIIETNLLGTIFCCQLLAPLMIRRKVGTIINFSTIAVALGLKGESVYVASKAGVEGFTRSFAREVADFGLSVVCVAPGPINTDLLKGITKEQISSIVSQQIIPKQNTPEDVCDLIEILLEPKSKSLSGQVFNVGGA